MAKPVVNHIARATAAWPILVHLARSGTVPISYGDLCAQLGLHHRAAGYFLGVIQQYCHFNKLPKLQALAVNKKTGLPGHGYIGLRANKAHQAELSLVHTHKWHLRAPKF